MTERPVTAITLRALEGEPLRDSAVRAMVEATARAIAERQGIDLRSLVADAGSITATLATGRIQALGFAAELRRLTTNWYTKKYGLETLWGDPPQVHENADDTFDDDDDRDDDHWLGDPDAWKRI